MIWITPSKFPFLFIVTKGSPGWCSQTGTRTLDWESLISQGHWEQLCGLANAHKLATHELLGPGQRLLNPIDIFQNAITLFLSALVWCYQPWCMSQTPLARIWCPLLSATSYCFLLWLHSLPSISLHAFSEAESDFCYLILWSTSVSAGVCNSSQLSIFSECHYHTIISLF